MFNMFKCFNIPRKNSGKMEYIVAGLGNPGSKYTNTRHNVGFMALDYIAREEGINFSLSRFDSKAAIVNISAKKVLLLKPQTYMNCSGQAVDQALSFYKLTPDNLVVIYDDTTLDVSKIRIRSKGSAGGHNGIQNIIDFVDSEVFTRIKIGVGAKPNKNWDLKDWVLSRFSSEDISKIDESIAMAYLALKLIISGETSQAMNKFNCKN